MAFLVNLCRDEMGMVVAECSSIPGCIARGKSEEEALANVRAAIGARLEARAAGTSTEESNSDL